MFVRNNRTDARINSHTYDVPYQTCTAASQTKSYTEREKLALGPTSNQNTSTNPLWRREHQFIQGSVIIYIMSHHEHSMTEIIGQLKVNPRFSFGVSLFLSGLFLGLIGLVVVVLFLFVLFKKESYNIKWSDLISYHFHFIYYKGIKPKFKIKNEILIYDLYVL